MFLSVDVAKLYHYLLFQLLLVMLMSVKFVPYPCRSLVSVVVFCLVAVELVMTVVVLVAVQVMSVNFILQFPGLLFCPHNVLVVVLLGVRLPVVRLGGGAVSFAISVGGLVDVCIGAAVVVVAV